MKRQIAFVGALVVMSSMLVQAQPAQAPKPGPEHKRLGVFLGSWSLDGEFKPGNAYGVPAGKTTWVERSQWMDGEFFLQMNRDGKGPWGEIKHLLVFGYDTVAKKHTGTLYGLTDGGSTSGAFTATGNTWLWSGSGHGVDGRAFQERCTITVTPAASYTYKCETSSEGKAWFPSFEGKATRLKS